MDLRPHTSVVAAAAAAALLATACAGDDDPPSETSITTDAAPTTEVTEEPPTSEAVETTSEPEATTAEPEPDPEPEEPDAVAIPQRLTGLFLAEGLDAGVVWQRPEFSTTPTRATYAAPDQVVILSTDASQYDPRDFLSVSAADLAVRNELILDLPDIGGWEPQDEQPLSFVVQPPGGQLYLEWSGRAPVEGSAVGTVPAQIGQFLDLTTGRLTEPVMYAAESRQTEYVTDAVLANRAGPYRIVQTQLGDDSAPAFAALHPDGSITALDWTSWSELRVDAYQAPTGDIAFGFADTEPADTLRDSVQLDHDRILTLSEDHDLTTTTIRLVSSQDGSTLTEHSCPGAAGGGAPGVSGTLDLSPGAFWAGSGSILVDTAGTGSVCVGSAERPAALHAIADDGTAVYSDIQDVVSFVVEGFGEQWQTEMMIWCWQAGLGVMAITDDLVLVSGAGYREAAENMLPDDVLDLAAVDREVFFDVLAGETEHPLLSFYLCGE